MTLNGALFIKQHPRSLYQGQMDCFNDHWKLFMMKCLRFCLNNSRTTIEMFQWHISRRNINATNVTEYIIVSCAYWVISSNAIIIHFYSLFINIFSFYSNLLSLIFAYRLSNNNFAQNSSTQFNIFANKTTNLSTYFQNLHAYLNRSILHLF